MSRKIEVSAIIETQSNSNFQLFLILLISTTAILEGFDAQLQGYTAPTIIKDWNVSKANFSQVFAFFQFGTMLGVILLGNLGDIVGRRKMVMTGVLMFGVFTVAGAYATDVPMLAATRFLSAVFLGGATPNAISLLIDYAPQQRRAIRVGIMYALYTGAGGLGGFVAAWCVPHLGWQSVYYIAGYLAVGFSVALFFMLPESVRFMVVRHQSKAALIATLRRLAPQADIPADAEFIIANEEHRKASVIELYKGGRAVITASLWGAYAVNLLALMFVTSWMPTVFVDAGLGYSAAVIATGLFQGGGAMGSLFCGWVLDRKKGIKLLSYVCLCGVPIIIAIGHAVSVVPLLMLLGLGAGVCVVGSQTGINALCGLLYPTALRSTGIGWAYGVGRIGSIIGPILGGLLIGQHLPLPQIFMIVAVPSLCVAAIIFNLYLHLALRERPAEVRDIAA
jgi:AAHS family 4-hydroxybenzoate transporter-like MFS transporter